MKQQFRAPARAALRFLSAANNQVHQNATIRNCATSGKTCGAAFLILCLISLVNCSGSRNSMGSIAPVVAVAPFSSTTIITTPQSHAINSTFGTPLMALVTSNGLPASGVAVNFAAPTTGASGTFAGKSSATATTDANGIATPPAFTANGIKGVYNVMASAPGAPVLATFNLTNTAGGPANIATVATSNNQSAPTETQFTNPLAVRVTDSGGNPVSGASVTFTAPATGASASFANSGAFPNVTTATTDATGTATSAAITSNGVASTYTVTAMVCIAPGCGASSGQISTAFTLTNVVGAPFLLTALSGTPQNEIANKVFAVPMSVLVADAGNNPIANSTVTFCAPASGASGTFLVGGNSTTTATSTTNQNGVAIAPTFTANATSGTYNLMAITNGSCAGFNPPTVTFSLNNWPVGSNFYSFYLSGQELLGIFGYYAVAGSVVIDPAGNVLAGEMDYNDGVAITSTQPTGDSISSGSLKVNTTTYHGTLALNTSNRNLGVGGSGVLTLGIQFVNANHAIVTQFDGTATSSGSLDLQTLPSTLSGAYSFTFSGIDPTFSTTSVVPNTPVAFGGVFSIANAGTTLQNGLIDTNDAETGAPPALGAPFTGTLTPPDTFGRGIITSTLSYPGAYDAANPGTPTPIVLNYYVVGPKVIRIIDVDPTDSAVGSAFSQGNNPSWSNASLTSSIFGLEGNLVSQYGAAGMFSTSSTAATFAGVADEDNVASSVLALDSTISGTYSVGSNGYGSMNITSSSQGGPVAAMGLYMTDPTLNLLDPNNASNPGGALLLDLDTGLAGGTGLVIPQTSPSAGFGSQYVFGAQDQNVLEFTNYEFDFGGFGTFTTGAFSGTAGLSDPLLTLQSLGLGETKAATPGVQFTGTPLADPSNVGRYTLSSANTTPNPLVITLNGTQADFNVVMYQANADQIFWLDEDMQSVFLGSFQQVVASFTPPGKASGVH